MGEVLFMYFCWNSYEGTIRTTKTENITWRMKPSFRLYQIRDNDDLYVEFEALYDHHLSNLWKLHTEIRLELYNTFSRIVPRPLIVINKNCYFDKCGQTESQMKSPIRFDFGKFGSVRSSLVPQNESLEGLTFRMSIQVNKKLTVGMQLPPPFNSGDFKKNVALEFITPKQIGGYREQTYIHFVVQKQELTKDRIEGILYLAVDCDIQCLIAECEEFLISTKEIPTTRKLFLAEKYHLAKLQLAALEIMKIEILKKDKLDIKIAVRRMSLNTLKGLLAKFCEE